MADAANDQVTGEGGELRVPTPAERDRSAPAAAADLGRVRLLAWASVLALLVQFLLGTATNLWVTIPHDRPWTGASPVALLWAHIVVGVALLGNGFMLVGRAARVPGDSRPLASAALSMVGVLVALGAGVDFVGGSQSNGASMAMAAGFAVAVAGAAGVLWLVPRPGAARSRDGRGRVGGPPPAVMSRGRDAFYAVKVRGSVARTPRPAPTPPNADPDHPHRGRRRADRRVPRHAAPALAGLLTARERP